MNDKRLQNFWATVDKNGPTPERFPELGPCWDWKGALRGGYGRTLHGISPTRKGAHRAVMELTRGEVIGPEWDVCSARIRATRC